MKSGNFFWATPARRFARLTAALALSGGDYQLSGVRACTSARLAT